MSDEIEHMSECTGCDGVLYTGSETNERLCLRFERSVQNEQYGKSVID